MEDNPGGGEPLRGAGPHGGSPVREGRCPTKSLQLVEEFVPEQLKGLRNKGWQKAGTAAH